MIKVGDVFKGKPGFEFGRVKADGVVEVSDSYHSTYIVSEVESYDSKTGVPNYVSTSRLAKDDSTRVDAEYVVESVVMTGGCDRECIIDEPHVIARRLNFNGTYKPTGERISFVYVSKGGRSNFTNACSVEVIRKMTRVVTFY